MNNISQNEFRFFELTGEPPADNDRWQVTYGKVKVMEYLSESHPINKAINMIDRLRRKNYWRY